MIACQTRNIQTFSHYSLYSLLGVHTNVRKVVKKRKGVNTNLSANSLENCSSASISVAQSGATARRKYQHNSLITCNLNKTFNYAGIYRVATKKSYKHTQNQLCFK
jgi:hypothetical protein